MARVLIEVGALRYDRTATNTKAARVLASAARARGYLGDPADNAAILIFIGDQLVAVLQEWALDDEQRAATDQAVAGVRSDPPAWSA